MTQREKDEMIEDLQQVATAAAEVVEIVRGRTSTDATGQREVIDRLEAALNRYNDRHGEPEPPTLSSAFSLVDGEWADRLAREARAVSREQPDPEER